jgi:hypothetical protein
MGFDLHTQQLLRAAGESSPALRLSKTLALKRLPEIQRFKFQIHSMASADLSESKIPTLYAPCVGS